MIYNLPAVLGSNQTIFFVEGEKDAERLGNLSLVATTSPMGAGSWDPGFASFFKGKRVACIPDNDEPGREFIEKVARDLHALQVAVRIVVLPDLPPKGDVSDYLDRNRDNANALYDLVRSAPDYSRRDKRQERQDAVAYFKSIGIDLPPASSLLPTEYGPLSRRAYSEITSLLERLTDDGILVVEKLDKMYSVGVRTARDYSNCLGLLMDLHQACHV